MTPAHHLRAALAVLLAIAVASGAWLLGAEPAAAAHSISFADCPAGGSPTPPPSEPPASPSPAPSPAVSCVVSGVRTITFTVTGSQVQPIQAVDLRIVSDTPGVPSPSGFPVTYPECEDKTSCTASYTWDTATKTPYNGTYHFRVTAATNQHTTFKDSKAIAVDNPPQTPGKPAIVVTTASGVSLRWDEAPEPDTTGFVLERAQTANKSTIPNDASFAPLVVTRETRALDDKVSKGVTYWYRLRSARKSVVSPNGQIVSAAGPASAPAQVGAAAATPKPGTTGTTTQGGKKAPLNRRQISRLRLRSLGPAPLRRPAPVPDAPYSAVLPYDPNDAIEEPEALGQAGFDVPEEGADPRGPVLPAAVGAFLVSAALAVGRLPRLDG